MTIICSNCQTELPAGARFCMNCGQPVVSLTAEDEARKKRMVTAAPQTLVEKAQAANRLSGERRIVTALFIDVVGSRLLALHLGQANAEEIIYAGLDLACPIIYRYEGTIAHLQEDELLVFFGAPVAHEDDPVRAVRAAMEVLSEIKAYAQTVKAAHGIDFEVRISLSTGPVQTGPIGEDLQYQYTALGDSLTLAAQMEATKRSMCVLVSESTYRFIAPIFECADLGQVDLSSASNESVQKIRMYEVKGLLSAPGQTRGLAGLESPMVGRLSELAGLVQLSRAVQAGLGRAVVILGEPGMGKTRLVQEWRKGIDHSMPPGTVRWLEGRCFSFGQEMAFHLVSSLLHSMIQLPETSNEPERRAAFQNMIEKLFPNLEDQLEIFPVLGDLLGLKLEGEALERVRYLDAQAHQIQGQSAMRRLLVALATRQPLIIVLEDLHWADPSSVSFLSAMLPLAAAEPVLFCLVLREERQAAGMQLVDAAREALGGRLSVLTLNALNPNESRQMVANLLEIEALPDTTRELILRKAEGNPFFVEEVIRMLIDRGAIIQMNGKWQTGVNISEIDIPDNLQGLLSARIDRLPDEVKQTLRVAAVIGRQFSLKILAHILNDNWEKRE
jgi:class 3 adenylate cyclase